MSVAFFDRPPMDSEVEKLRLVLSTFQDGSGMLQMRDQNLPGWRDFERAVASVLGGYAQESKALFDVVLPLDGKSSLAGISCKMRDALPYLRRHGRVTIELSNSARKFSDALLKCEISKANYGELADLVGKCLVETVRSWHASAIQATRKNGVVQTSCYLVLLWGRKTGEYQLFQFPMTLADSDNLEWRQSGKRIVGTLDHQTVYEWYPDSGGQLKYYPRVEDAMWQSKVFRLEALSLQAGQSGLLDKAREYFPEQWKDLG